jgi:hypothetical protein
VKWVKGNFLAGRDFADDDDLGGQSGDWTAMANQRPSAATGVPPMERLAEEAAQGGVLPTTAADYGLLVPGQVAADATVAVAGNRYSVPVTHVRAPVIVRLHGALIRIWRDAVLLADHFALLFERIPRTHAMLYREVPLSLGDPAPTFIGALSQRQRARRPAEIRAVYALYEQHGAAHLLAAMALACTAGTYSADALALLLTTLTVPALAPILVLPGLPQQTGVDRSLGSYEMWVQVEAVQEVLS